MGCMHKKYHSCDVVYLNGDLVCRITHKQPVVAVSCAESEYIAVSNACKDALSVFHFLNEFV